MFTNTVVRNDTGVLLETLCQACSLNMWELVQWLVQHVINNQPTVLSEAIMTVYYRSEWYFETRLKREEIVRGMCAQCQALHFGSNQVQKIIPQQMVRLKLTHDETCRKGLRRAFYYGRLNLVSWLTEHTAVRRNLSDLDKALHRAYCSGFFNVVEWVVDNKRVKMI